MATHTTNFAEMKVEKAAPTILFGKKAVDLHQGKPTAYAFVRYEISFLLDGIQKSYHTYSLWLTDHLQW